ncbi:MAG: glycerate kinase [Actinomycetes bacterium]
MSALDSSSGLVVVAPDKFKGSLSAPEASAAIARGLRAARPGLGVVEHPVADGGEGTVAVAVRAGFTHVRCAVTGPSGDRLAAAYALRGRTAVIELAQAAGVRRLGGRAVAPGAGTTRGVGELLVQALDQGAQRIVVGAGGSVTTDGGAGLVRALGAELYDALGHRLAEGGSALAGAARLEVSRLDPRLARIELLVACDVDNPLLGPRGAAVVYGPQKGATPGDVRLLEAGLTRWAELVAAATGADLRDQPGAGAAGGAGFGLAAVLGARLLPGIDLMLDLTGYRDVLAGACLVVTGEGSLDAQSLRGKAPVGVARQAAARGVPTVAVAGQCRVSPAALLHVGIQAVYPLTDLEPDLRRCQADAAVLVERVATRIAADWLTGRGGTSTGRPVCSNSDANN